MKEQLKNIASIKTGIYAKAKAGEPEEIYYLQFRDFDEYHSLRGDLKPSIPIDKNTQKHLLEKGDLLIVAKGVKHFAVVYKGEVKPAVASSAFMVIKCQEKQLVEPSFLAWYINHPRQQKVIETGARGTSLSSINKQVVGSLELSIPPIAVQKIIVHLDELRKKEQALQNQIRTLKESVFNQQLINTCINY